MKKFVKSVLGVTLLEVMLVLAIAAMIIVMSVRYYQSANASQQTNSILAQITAIVSAADSLSQSTGSYAGVTTTTITSVVPANSMTTPWGTDITISAQATSSFTVQIPTVPTNVCPLMVARLQANAHFTNITACGNAPTTVSTTYIANP
jgi:type II secretory pathway pseudopilin PulG